ncbi:MAG: Do family serine endopeptidase, partial [Gemmatimonadota bacterium]
MTDPLTAKIRVLTVTALVAGFGLGAASIMGWTNLSFADPAITQAPQVSEDLVQPAVDLSNAFVEISRAVTPAVVRIEVERPRTVAQGPGQNPFERFFNPPEGRGGQQQPQQLPPQIAGGSGFIVSQDGYVLTNNHVVSDATQIQVHLPDGREYPAELVGTDPTTDVAVIKIDERNLPTLSLGSSSEVRVGEWVLAVGNPGFGRGSPLEYTVTTGIVSAIGRPLQLLQQELLRQEEFQEVAGYAIEDFIQTDAVINPGNSGGPLVNVRGQVVGINTAISSPTGFYQGYGFAIPIDLAQRIMVDLVEFGQVRRALLGVSMRAVTNVDAEYYGLPRPTGVLVEEATSGGPAQAAGIQPEDVIVAVDGEPVERPGQLQLRIAQRRPGDEVTVRFYRNAEPQEVQVRLGEADLAPRTAQAPSPQEPQASERLGIEVVNMTSEIAAEAGYDVAEGVIIRQVAPTGPAGRGGVIPGEVIQEINREEISDVADVDRLLADLQGGDIVSLRLGRPDGG